MDVFCGYFWMFSVPFPPVSCFLFYFFVFFFVVVLVCRVKKERGDQLNHSTTKAFETKGEKEHDGKGGVWES